VKRRLQARTVIAFGLGLVMLGTLIYLAFELGRYQAGYALIDQRRERATLEQNLSDRDRSIEELKRQVALLETSRGIDRETYAQVEANLGQLQERIQAQEEELAFYRGIVSPQDGLSGLRIQELELLPADAERTYLMRLVLVQAIINTRAVSGVVKVQVAGAQDGAELRLDLADLLTGEESADIAYQFRYFQGFERALSLPVGFEPSRIEIEIWPSGSGSTPVKRSFEWAAVLG
jgi:hypothetical protein